MNILQAEDMIKGMPDQALIQEAQSPSGQFPQYLAVSEIQRRQDMRKRFQQQQQEQPQGTVADQIIGQAAQGSMPPPQGVPPSPQPNGMAGGGIVRLQSGGLSGRTMTVPIGNEYYEISYAGYPSQQAAFEAFIAGQNEPIDRRPTADRYSANMTDEAGNPFKLSPDDGTPFGQGAMNVQFGPEGNLISGADQINLPELSSGERYPPVDGRVENGQVPVPGAGVEAPPAGAAADGDMSWWDKLQSMGRSLQNREVGLEAPEGDGLQWWRDLDAGVRDIQQRNRADAEEYWAEERNAPVITGDGIKSLLSHLFSPTEESKRKIVEAQSKAGPQTPSWVDEYASLIEDRDPARDGSERGDGTQDMANAAEAEGGPAELVNVPTNDESNELTNTTNQPGGGKDASVQGTGSYLERLAALADREYPDAPDLSGLVDETRRDAYSNALIQLGAGIAGNDLPGGLSRAGIAAIRGKQDARSLQAQQKMLEYQRGDKELARDVEILGRAAVVDATIVRAEVDKMIEQGRSDRDTLDFIENHIKMAMDNIVEIDPDKRAEAAMRLMRRYIPKDLARRSGLGYIYAKDGGGGDGKAVQIQSQEDYFSLPSGALYIDPNGVTRRKP